MFYITHLLYYVVHYLTCVFTDFGFYIVFYIVQSSQLAARVLLNHLLTYLLTCVLTTHLYQQELCEILHKKPDPALACSILSCSVHYTK